MSSPSLLALRVTLTFSERDPQVELALMRDGEIVDNGGRIWRIRLSSLDVPTSIESDTAPALSLPLQVLEGLRTSLADEPKTLPLWLSFAKPHGYLGVLPWERVLTEALARPVLRLPDLLERPRENPEVLQIAICFDTAPETPQEKAVEQITSLVDTIIRVSPRSQTRISLFTAAGWFERLRASKLDRRVQHPDPVNAPTCREAIKRASAGEQQGVESPWSIWISESLGTRSLDAIHFICRSDITDGGPALVMLSSPSPRESVPALSYTSVLELAG